MNGRSVPVAMIGVGVAGVVWLVARECQGRGAGDRAADRRGEGADDEAPYLFAEYDWAGESANGYTPGLAYGEADLLRGLVRAEAGSGPPSMGARLQHLRNSASRQIRRSTSVGQERLRYWLQANPLLLGAAAAVIGAAVGSALSETNTRSDPPRR